MAEVEFRGVVKEYGPLRVLDAFDLTLDDGEFVVLVGPSGCGKSTALKIAAGLEPATGGTVLIGGNDVTDAGPGRRDIAMVFQNYALYPHLTVRGNLAFGLRMRGETRARIGERVDEAARMLGIGHLLDRKPKALSGGQRQRVALGRAIVRRPKAFLMDEPLSNLDAKLRVQMRAEIGGLHKRLGVTTLYVTHDQVEAMTMADRIVIMRDGVIQQIADPDTMYADPANIFVASFIGSPGTNFFKARLDSAGGATVADVLGTRVPVALRNGTRADQEVVVGIRPEAFSQRPHSFGFRSPVALVESLGSEKIVHLAVQDDWRAPDLAHHAVDAGAGGVVARLAEAVDMKASAIDLHFDAAAVHLYDAATGALVGRGAAA